METSSAMSQVESIMTVGCMGIEFRVHRAQPEAGLEHQGRPIEVQGTNRMLRVYHSGAVGQIERLMPCHPLWVREQESSASTARWSFTVARPFIL